MGVIVANRSLVKAEMMGVEDTTPIHIMDVELMTEGSIVGINLSLETSGMDHLRSHWSYLV